MWQVPTFAHQVYGELPAMVTSRQIDELEQSLLKFHNNHSRLSLEGCTHVKCVDAKLALAWLRTRLQDALRSAEEWQLRDGTHG
jgi:Holliday junction resolvasome RuvABC DNA-binding subunit